MGPDPSIASSLFTNLFDLDVSVLEKIARSLLVFMFLVVALRLGGKRELGQINVLDLVVLLLVSNALQNAMIGDDNTLTGGMIGAATLFVANYLFVRLVFHYPRARRILDGTPVVLAQHGKAVGRALRREAITVEELQSAALERGFRSLEDTDLVVLEPNGHLAVMGREAATGWRQRNVGARAPASGVA